MKRDVQNLSLATAVAWTFVTLCVLSSSMLLAQSAHPSGSDKPQANASSAATADSARVTSTPAAYTTPTAATSAKQQTPPAKTAGMVWVNTATGMYHKPGTRWYGKTKKGKYMLEADAIKAGSKPAK
jgi:hypothetical protein